MRREIENFLRVHRGKKKFENHCCKCSFKKELYGCMLLQIQNTKAGADVNSLSTVCLKLIMEMKTLFMKIASILRTNIDQCKKKFNMGLQNLYFTALDCALSYFTHAQYNTFSIVSVVRKQRTVPI